MKKFLIKHSSGKKVLFLFILTNLVYVFMLMVSIPAVMEFANGMKLFDMLPTGYDFEYARELLTALGEEGRQIYLMNQIPVDMVYPFLFGISYSLLLIYLLGKINPNSNKFFYLAYLPLAAGLFDYFENFSIIVMISAFPDITNLQVWSANIFTLLKSWLTTLYFVVLLITLVALLISKLKRKK